MRNVLLKTSMALATIAVLSLLAPYAYADDEAVLREARRRAQRQRVEQSTQTERQDEDVFLPIAISFIPGPPIPGLHIDANIGLAPIISILDDVYGVQAAGIGAIAEGKLYGLQGGGIFAIGGGPVAGAQMSGIFNIAAQGVSGVQSAGVFNIASGRASDKDTRTIQLAGVFNLADDDLYGMQAAGIFNIADRDMAGVQAAGVFNVAHDVTGAQVSSIVNVAHTVRGVQVGLVNVTDNLYGLSFGLVNIVKNGIFDAGVWQDDDDRLYAFLQRGSNTVYSILYAGLPKEDLTNTAEHLAAGAGLGYRLGGGRRWAPALDLDLSVKGELSLESIADAMGGGADYTPALFPSLRASLRVPVGLGFALHGGVILDADVGDWATVADQFRSASPYAMDAFGTKVTLHPSFFLGLSL